MMLFKSRFGFYVGILGTLCAWSGCPEYATVQEVKILREKLAEVQTEATMALANASCRPEVVELMKEVAKFCNKQISCSDSLILSAISDADPEDRFLSLMKSQRSAAFYFPDPWNNQIHLDRMTKLLSKRQLPRTKVLVVANSTPRKVKAQVTDQNVAVPQAQDRAAEVVKKIKERVKALNAEPGSSSMPLVDDDIRIWVVPYLVKESDLAQLPQDAQPPVGYADLIETKQKLTPQQQQQRFQKLQQAVLRSVWIFLIDCWPLEKPKPERTPEQPAPPNDGDSQNSNLPSF